MSVVNGQIANQTTFNSAFMSRTAPTTSTVAKITLANPLSTTIVDAQTGMNETFDAVGMTGVADTTRKNYSSNYAVVDGDSHKVALGKVDLKFGGIGVGHAHTGADGDGDQVSALTLADFNPYRAAFQEFTISTVSGLTFDVSTPMAGKVAGGGTAVAGVITSAPNNNAYLIDASNGTFVEDAEGQVVYGRITYATGVWTLSFYTNEAGTETAYSLPSTASIKVIFREVFTSANYPTIPSDPGQFGTLDVTADVVDASSTLRGVVSIVAQSFSGVKTFLARIVRASATGITAFAGGGQASATALTKNINNITTVATADDSVKLPAAVAGEEITVILSASKRLAIYPQTGESIDSLGANASYLMSPEQKVVSFVCAVAGAWISLSKKVAVFGSTASPVSLDVTVGFTEAAGNMSSTADEQIIFFRKSNTGTAVISASPEIQNPTRVGQKLTLINVDGGDLRSAQIDGAEVNTNGLWDSYENGDNALELVSVTTSSWFEKSRRA